MRLSVIIVTHNSAGVLGPCHRSLRTLMPQAEIIVVDNDSTDGTARMCHEHDITLLRNAENVGFGRACNQGAVAASGSHILFVNPDVEVVQVDESALEAEAETEPFGLVAPIFEHGWRGGSLNDHWSRDLMRQVIRPLRPRELPRAPRLALRQTPWWPVGALLLVNRAEFNRVGGFDQRFFLYYEDLDLARRYRAGGLPVRQTQSVRAHHRRGRSSTGELSGVTVRHGWSYLSWIEYLCTWNGRDTAKRAARSARRLRRGVDRALAVLEHAGPISRRATRKRRELAALESFVQWQCTFGEGTADEDFCPEAREIVGAL